MTEYETADLALSKKSLVTDLIAAVQVQGTSITDGIELFMTILFTFIAVSYLVGASLSRKQTWILTGLYLFWQIFMIILIVAKASQLGALAGWIAKEVPHAAALIDQGIYFRYSGLLLLSLALAASLYFMWTVRHPKNE